MVSQVPDPSATAEGHRCVTAAIFWMKARGGWRETPQTHEVSYKDPRQMTDEELIDRNRELDPLARSLPEAGPDPQATVLREVTRGGRSESLCGHRELQSAR